MFDSGQQAIYQSIAAAEYRELLASTKTKQRLISSSATMASSWLLAFPTTPELTLTDEEFRFAIKHRLGLPCADDLPLSCRCNKSLMDDPAHFHSCHLLKRTAITARHDMIVRSLANFFRMVGAVVHIEPRIIGFERRRPDLDIISADRSLLIDVAVAHPAAPSRNSLTPLAAAASTEATKVGKYGVLAAARAATFLPFVMESFGAFGKEALKVLHILHKAAANASSSPLLSDSRLPDPLCCSSTRQLPNRQARRGRRQSRRMGSPQV